MQLLIRYDCHDRAAFLSAHKETWEERDGAGLTQLQLWEEPDHADRVWGLYGVSDRGKAEAWLSKTAALAQHVSGHDAHFLATV